MTCAPPKTYQNQKKIGFLQSNSQILAERVPPFFLSHQKHVFVKHPMSSLVVRKVSFKQAEDVCLSPTHCGSHLFQGSCDDASAFLASQEAQEVMSLTDSVSALCCYPNVKVEIRDSSQICTTALIFLKSNYFRQKYLEIPSCAVSLFIYIWV